MSSQRGRLRQGPVDNIDLPKTAAQLFLSYSGREEITPKKLQKMKVEKTKVRELIHEIEALTDAACPPNRCRSHTITNSKQQNSRYVFGLFLEPYLTQKNSFTFLQLILLLFSLGSLI